MRLKANHFDGFPGLSMKSRDELLAKQPETVIDALKIPGVGRATTRRLLELGLLADPDGVQDATISQLEREHRRAARALGKSLAERTRSRSGSSGSRSRAAPSS